MAQPGSTIGELVVIALKAVRRGALVIKNKQTIQVDLTVIQSVSVFYEHRKIYLDVR